MADEPIIDPAASVPSAADATVAVPSSPSEAVVASPSPVVEAPVVEAHPIEVPSLLQTFAEGEKPPAEKPVEAKVEGDGGSSIVEPKVEAKPAEVKAEEPKPAEKPAEVKPPEVKPTDAKPAEAAPVEAAPVVEAPFEYKFAVPENFTLKDEQRAAITTAFDAFRANPNDAQPLIDMHVAALQDFGKQVLEQSSQQQYRDFNKMREDWRTEIKADPEIGGNGYHTAMTKIAEVRDALVSDHPKGSPEYMADMKELNQFLAMTGAGDHKIFMKMLHRGHRFFAEPKPMGADIKPPPNVGKRPGSRSERMYDNTNFGPKG